MTSLKTVRAVCPLDCPDTCSMLVTVRDGHAETLRGDPDHRFTQGYLCGKVSKYLDRVYHPDRLKFPMVRSGPKGAGQFRRVSWDDALDLIAERLDALRRSPEGPQTILPYSYAGTMGQLQSNSLDRRFFHRLGASLLDRTICATAGAAGSNITLGTRAYFDPETVTESKLILNWGSNTSVTNMHMWTLMHQARRHGAKIVTIDPHRSKTAEKSDQWLAIRPGTDAALALGLMHVIFRDNLQDDEYLNRYCLGADQLRDRALKEYPPERVAGITGLSVDEIVDLARAYATTHPSALRLNYGLQRHGGGGMAVRTIVCLPAVVGAWRHVGGGAFLSTSKTFGFNSAALERPDLIPPGTRAINMSRLADALTGNLDGPPVRALIVYNSNPAAIAPDQSRVLEGLRRDDLFTVVLEHFQTDTADHADVLLPATMQLEHFDLHGTYGHFYVQTNPQAIAPVGEAKPNTEVFRLLARRMGFEPELFDVPDEELAEAALRGSPTLEGITVERLHREGPIRLNLPERFAPFAQGNFPTESGKCELFSPILERQGLDPLPTYTPPHEDPQTRPELAVRFPLQLLTPPKPAFMNSTFANHESHRRLAGEPTLEIHPDDAASRGLVEGESVRIFNDRGDFVAKASIGSSVRPGVVVALGVYWNRHTPTNSNCNATTSTALTDFGGGATLFDNLVQVERYQA